MRLAVIGGGWAGIAAAVQAVQAGHDVTLYEMAPRLGGRARSVDFDGLTLDNGQHILIGAYRDTLALMRRVGADPDKLLLRQPLALTFPDGQGLELRPGAAVPALLGAIVRRAGWRWGDRFALLRAAAGWRLARFRCDPGWTVARLTASLPARVRSELIDPLCVAALNTPATHASATVLLRVLADALFGAAGGADLLLPRRPLDELLPLPAARWLAARGATLHFGCRVQALQGDAGGRWRVDGAAFDAVVLACTVGEAARLTRDVAPAWSALAAAFVHEPIVTVYLRSPGTRLPRAMTALHEGAGAPAQFVFDHGCIGGDDGLFAAVVSGARDWVGRGLDATAQAVLRQLVADFAPGTWRSTPRPVRTLAEKRATFACVPGLLRPPRAVAPKLVAAGDYVDGPYPSTLEGAVRSGLAAIESL
jgi:squalene-associated FAD-dependent desaturase